MSRKGDTSLFSRLVAVAVILGASAMIAYHHRDDLFPPEKAAEAGLNPEFVKCRDERTAQVRKMKSEGLISDQQVSTFTERAVAFCTSQFPPDAVARN